MLGKLAKWLRILGYDTHYQPSYPEGVIEQLSRAEGRVLLTRCSRTLKMHSGGVFIRSDHVGDQLCQLVEEGWIRPDSARGFQRCIRCNEPLVEADPESVREGVPEFVRVHNEGGFRGCPACGRMYWAGSHRERMLEQLVSWGVLTSAPADS